MFPLTPDTTSMENSREQQGPFTGEYLEDYPRAPGPNRQLLSLWKPPLPLFLGLLVLGEGIPMNMFVLFFLIGCCVTQREVTTLGTPAENRDFNPAAQGKLGKNTYICSVALGSWLRG